MKFGTKTGHPAEISSDCIIAGVYENGELTPSAKQLDRASTGAISRILEAGDLKGKTGQTLLLHNLGGIKAKRLLLVGCGNRNEITDRSFRQLASAAAKALKKTGSKEALNTLVELKLKDQSLTWKTRELAVAICSSEYQFNQMKGARARKNVEKSVLRKVNFHSSGRSDGTAIRQGFNQGQAISSGMDLTRDLANLPGNVCTPSYLAKQARSLGRSHDTIKTSILDEKAMEKLGMGALLSVSRGSRQPAKLIIMEYNGQGRASAAGGGSQGAANTKGRNKSKPVVLVGKGLTFDAGGISLKPAAAMDEMKYDMCGGASVFGTIKAIAEMELPINVVGIIPSSENLPDGDANKPGDIVTSMSGQTIEILNTDAEGRLILCDALTYAKKFDPAEVIDIATLTGACIIALGKHACGLLSNDDKLAEKLLEAGRQSGDRAWRLPIWDEYDEQLKSPFADMANIGGREAGTITAACFLARYTKDYKWAHLDIAGTAWKSGADKGATGKPVPLLTQYLINRAARS